MTPQVPEKERAFDSIDRAGAPLNCALQPIDGSVAFAEAGMEIGEVVGRDEFAGGAIAQLLQDLLRPLDIAVKGVGLRTAASLPDLLDWRRVPTPVKNGRFGPIQSKREIERPVSGG